MRSIVIAAMSAFVTLPIVSIGYAQSDRRATEQPSGQSSAPADRALAPNNQAPAAGKDGSVPGITPAQESQIPYRPCKSSVVLADGSNKCLD